MFLVEKKRKKIMLRQWKKRSKCLDTSPEKISYFLHTLSLRRPRESVRKSFTFVIFTFSVQSINPFTLISTYLFFLSHFCVNVVGLYCNRFRLTFLFDEKFGGKIDVRIRSEKHFCLYFFIHLLYIYYCIFHNTFNA